MNLRPLISIIFSAVVLTILGLRMVDLQVVQGQDLKAIAEDNRQFRKRIVAHRGLIYDRFDQPLVYNKPLYYRLEEPKQLYSKRTVISAQEAHELLATKPEHVFMDEFRAYSYPQSMSHLTGYIGLVTAQELQNSPEFRLNQQVGKTGLEYRLQDALQGQDGAVVYEMNARGELQRQLSLDEPLPGDDIFTTLDPELSEFVFEQMKDKKGAVIIGDSATGAILSMISSPAFDSNAFTFPALDDTQELEKKERISKFFDDENLVFFNRAIAGGYPLGSVFKLVTALSGLEVDAVDEQTTVVDEGVLKVGDFEYGNWYFRQYGRVEGEIGLVRAISRSNDIFFYKVAEWVGPEKLAQFAHIFGFGEKTGIELPAEASGLVPDPAWKEKVTGERWYLGNTYHYGIGQGDLLVTPIQVFQAVSAIGNYGSMCEPTLLKSETALCRELGIDQANLDIVHQGMVDACSAGGTAFPFFAWNDSHEHKVACKTGTAEFGAADTQGHRKTHGWFAASADMTDAVDQTSRYPNRIVVVVLVESDEEVPFREGSTDAAPIAVAALKWIEENR